MSAPSYQPLNPDLDEIRLLVLQPGQGEEDIVQVEVVHASLKDKPEYEALSYAWGHPHITETVHLFHPHPQEPSLRRSNSVEFQATSNLESALRHLRYKDKPRTLWVDAICINQKDDKEKIHQIQQMGNIYRQAAQKCLWLGPAADNSDAAMDVVNAYGNAPASERAKILKDPKWDSSWRALYPLICRSWFSRRWVMQEVALASDQTLYCGKRSTTWEYLFDAMYYLDREVRRRFIGWGIPEEELAAWDTGHDNITEMNNLLTSMKKHGHLPLSNLLVILSKKAVMDERDAVHAVLSLAEESQHATFKVQHPASTKDVFLAAVELSIFGGKSLDIIARKFVLPSKMPSWIPQFYDASNSDRDCGRNLVDHGLPFMIESPYSASGSSRPIANINKKEYQLSIQGFVVDHVKETLEPPKYSYRSKQIPKSWKPHALCFPQASTDMGTRDPAFSIVDEDTNFESFWRTMVLDRPLISRTKTTAPERWGKVAKKWFEGDLIVQYPVAKAAQDEEAEDLDKFLDNLYWAVHDKTFITTEQKRIGLVSALVQKGDLVCVLFGCSVPLILRPATGPEGESHFVVVGDAYIHGIMDGEVIKSPEYKTQTFTLV